MALKTFLTALGFPGAFRTYLARVFRHTHCHIACIVTEYNSIVSTVTETNYVTVVITDNTGA